jgi:hypothetical protein
MSRYKRLTILWTKLAIHSIQILFSQTYSFLYGFLESLQLSQSIVHKLQKPSLVKTTRH